MKMILIGLLALSMNAWAGERGNGGHGIFCPGKNPVIIDYYEASLKRYGSVPKLLPEMDSDTLMEIVENRLNQYPAFLATFQWARASLGPAKDWTYVDELPLQQINDSNEAYVFPSSCSKVQLAVRQGRDVFISEASFNKLSEGQQAILELHEVIYFIAESYGKETSREVRQLIRELIIQEVNTARLSQKIKELGGNSTTTLNLEQEVKVKQMEGKIAKIVQDTMFDVTNRGDIYSPQNAFGALFGKSADNVFFSLLYINYYVSSYVKGLVGQPYDHVETHIWNSFGMRLSENFLRVSGCSMPKKLDVVITVAELNQMMTSSLRHGCVK